MRWDLRSVARVDRTWFGLPVLLAGGLGIALLIGASFAYGQPKLELVGREAELAR